MNEEQRKEQGDPGRGGHEPFVAGISDGVTTGYQALEYVLVGLRESIRLRRRTGTGRVPGSGGAKGTGGGGSTRSGHSGAPLDLDDLLGFFAGLLENAGEIVEEVAYYIRDHTGDQTKPHAHGQLDRLQANAGETATVKFHVHNTGSSLLREVDFVATELIGDAGRIVHEAVTFDPPEIESIPIGGRVEASVVVAVPSETPEGTYHGVVGAEPGGAWAVLELNVLPEKVKVPTETPEPAPA